MPIHSRLFRRRRLNRELLKHGFKPNSVEIIQTILHPVFNVAVKDGYIRINPTDGVIAEIKKSYFVFGVVIWISIFPASVTRCMRL